MDRLGVGAADLHKINPRLIYGSSSGYGKDGPYRDYPAMDLVMQAMCGVINSTGFPDQPPVKSGAAVCDFMAGIHLYAAIMTALYERERTGKGRVVEVVDAGRDLCLARLEFGMLHARGAAAPARTGNRHGGLGIVAVQRLRDERRLRRAQRAGRPSFPRDPRRHGPARPEGRSALPHALDARREFRTPWTS